MNTVKLILALLLGLLLGMSSEAQSTSYNSALVMQGIDANGVLHAIKTDINGNLLIAGVTASSGTGTGTGTSSSCTPVIAIGSVTQGSAAASITGSGCNYTLNLVLPQGANGTNGSTPGLTMGTVTTGAAGSQAAASITGTAPNYVLNLTLPQGATGNPVTYTWRPSAVCNAGSAYPAALSVFDNNAPVLGCVSPSTSTAAYMRFDAAPASPQYAVDTVALPTYWLGSDLTITWYTTATSGVVQWQVSTACIVANGSTASPLYSTAQTVASTASSTANGTVYTAQLPNIATSGTNSCTAGELLSIRISRSSSDTLSAGAYLLGATLSQRRSQ